MEEKHQPTKSDLNTAENERSEPSDTKQKGTTRRGKKDSSNKSNSKKEEFSSDLSIEEAFEKLNLIIHNLDGEDLPLEESFRLYQEGVHLLQYCNAKVDMVEKQMIVLNGEENRDEF